MTYALLAVIAARLWLLAAVRWHNRPGARQPMHAPRGWEWRRP